MVIIELTYQTSLDKVDALLKAHRLFLKTYIDQGIFIASGPKSPRDGGIIIALGDVESLQTVIKNDPFYQHKLASYRLIAFEASIYPEAWASLLD